MPTLVLPQLQGLSRAQKKLSMMAVDFLLLVFSGMLALFLVRNSMMSGSWPTLLAILGIPLISIPVFARMGLYRAVIRYLGEQAMKTVAKAVGLTFAIWACVMILLSVMNLVAVDFRVLVTQWLLATLGIVASRMLVKEWLWRPVRNQYRGNNVLIYGAGDAGVELANALSLSRELYPVAFVDDDARLLDREVAGLKVYPLSHLEQVIPRFGIKEVLLALPEASRSRRHEIIRKLERHPVHARVLPSMYEIAKGKVSVNDLREADIEDLLGRDSVPPDSMLLSHNVEGKVVLITGAGGSIGSELCRQIRRLNPAKMVLLEHSEHALYQLDRELSKRAHDSAVEMVTCLASVLNQRLVESVIQAHEVETIYHAAAYKHVPLMESNEIEGVRNNVFGTLRVAQAAINKRVETVVLISTDKAVRPTNVMGASKRMAELILQALHQKVSMGRSAEGGVVPLFCMVRFGNVLGSSGSVIPLFREQIASGGAVTVTHPKVTRYFMSIPEAAQLVIQAGALAEGGDVFVLDMGKPVRILDLARQMIHLSGLEVRDDENPKGDVPIEFSGLRPGEKLYEELLIGDNPIGTAHSKIMRAKEEMIPWVRLESILTDLESAMDDLNRDKVRDIVLTLAKGQPLDAQEHIDGLKVVGLTPKSPKRAR